MPADNESVIESGSQTGADGVEQNGDAGGQSSPELEAQGSGEENKQPRENAIPHSRVEEMIARRVEKERASWEKEHLAPLRQKYEDGMSRLTNAQIAWLEKMGFIEREQPKPLTRDEFDKRFKDFETQVMERSNQAYYYQQIQSGFEYGQTKYPELIKSEYFQDMVLSAYQRNPARNFNKIIDEAAKFIGANRGAAQQVERERQMDPSRRVVPSGRGAGGGGRHESNKKQSVAERIQARLKASRESGD